MSARYCNHCGRINPAENHPLGGCTCPRPDFTVRPTAGEQIRSLEDQLATLRSEVRTVIGSLGQIVTDIDKGKVDERTRSLAQSSADDLLAALREDSRRLGKLGGEQ